MFVFIHMSGMSTYSLHIRSLLLAALLVFFPYLSTAQSEIPDKPDLIRVTVDHTDQGILVQWEPSEDEGIEFYKLYRMINRTGQEIVTLPGNVYSYKHMNTGLKNLEYSVTAIDSSGNESLLTPGEHRAVSASLQFDTCAMAVQVSWSPYVGWEGNVSGYRIYGGQAGEEPGSLGFVSPTTLSFTHEGISRDAGYHYYIEAIRTDRTTSLSPVATVETAFPDAPGFITVDQVSVLDDHTLELQFSADVDGPVNSFRLMKRSNDLTPFTEVGMIDNAKETTLTTEDRFPTTVETYEYIVQSVYQPEGCPDRIVLSQSNPGTNILLTCALENQAAMLEWTPYREYPAGLSGYVIQRRNGSGEFLAIHSVGPETTRWSEPVSSVINGFQSGEVRYRVLAVENQAGTGNPGMSMSNIVSVNLPTELIMPNAFTPGSNDMNFEFRPRIDFAPREYIMIIFDRAGRKLFETSDPGHGWDGRFRGNDFVAEGVYVYFIQFTDYTGLTRTLTGNVTVLYPSQWQ